MPRTSIAQTQIEITRAVAAEAGSALIACPPRTAPAGWLLFRRPVEILSAEAPDQVPSVMEKVEAAAAAGLWAAGFISYEAAPGFDKALRVRDGCRTPPAWFGIYRQAVPAAEPDRTGDFQLGAWSPSVSQAEYDDCIRAIRNFIAAGDTYQVNYTFRLDAPFHGDDFAFFRRLCSSQRSPYAAYINTGRLRILSASPELFFDLDGQTITARPMKGTAGRRLSSREDEQAGKELARSEKNRAENLMIVDLLRNDIGRIAEVGSVRADRLFETERYETLWQMTSTVTGRTAAPLPRITAALFPCGSVTGAPKVRTMQIISELETRARSIYTGAIGYVAPGRRARFNVAIRTVLIDTETHHAEYGVGGGITWDSTAADEYEECLLKAKVLTEERPAFRLLETMLLDRDGYFLLERHMTRLGRSAEYFSFELDEEHVRGRLRELAQTRGERPLKVRLLLSRDGGVELQAQALARRDPSRAARVALAASPIDPSDVFLYHKTTRRDVYEQARKARPGVDDVILYNSSGELTESTVANLVVELDGRLFTPPVRCGLLPGTLREELIARGEVAERALRPEDLSRAGAIYLVNSVRGFVRAALVG